MERVLLVRLSAMGDVVQCLGATMLSCGRPFFWFVFGLASYLAVTSAFA